MIEIIPALIVSEFKELESKLNQLEGAVSWAQVDVADGLFAPTVAGEFCQELLRVNGRLKLEAHLMIEQPELYLRDWMRVADRIIVHPESTNHLPEILQSFESSAVKCGLALLLETPLERLEEFRGRFDLVQLMGIKQIGRQGESFDPQVIERVRILRAQYPDVTISVDGGVNLDNAAVLVAAGANQLVVGSAIWRDADPLAAIRKFQNLVA